MRSEMEKDILKVLVTEEEIKARIAEMGETLYEQFRDRDPLFLGVLKGSFVFMADLAGFTVPDEFVVGYGLDYCQQYRNVPYIGVLKPEVYSNH